MKKLLLFSTLALVALFNSCNTEVTVPAAEDVRDGMFIHLTAAYENPHRVLMAFRMAEIMSEDKDVLVYCDIEAVKILLKDSEDISMPDMFPSLKESISKLLANGVTIQACPGCLKVAGKSPEDLMEGIVIADKEKFFSFTKGRIVTIDY
jgi:predicted peroxiredoxin